MHNICWVDKTDQRKKCNNYLNVIIWDVIDKVLDSRLDIVTLYSFHKHLFYLYTVVNTKMERKWNISKILVPNLQALSS